jgi:hypothetical protein
MCCSNDDTRPSPNQSQKYNPILKEKDLAVKRLKPEILRTVSRRTTGRLYDYVRVCFEAWISADGFDVE